jgi:hypothetical protein
MKTDYNIFNDRRTGIRKPYKAKVHLQLNEIIKGYGYTIDISMNGACIRSPELFVFLRPEQADVILNLNVDVSFVSESLTLQGKIIRIDWHEKELALRILETSTPKRWMALCS